jgi:hypothetical protein
VGFRRQRAERHAGAVEALQDRLDRLDLLQRHGIASARRRKQVAQAGDGAVVHQLGEQAVAP